MRVIYDITILATHSNTRTKFRICQGEYYKSGDKYVFELEQTKRWFDQSSFTPEPGFLLIPEGSDCAYRITNVDYLNIRPKHAIFTAVPATLSEMSSSNHAAS